ncbi:MAG TPA: tryptophan 7-halogenase, partial [Longimicrobiales bacterium]|nr:tryptophan 7-halogenase [Longimicrobiales bacterium]
LFDGVSARSAERGDGSRWTITCERDGGAALTLDAPWIVDATGRHGLLARAWREPDRSTTTLALVRRWRRPGGWPGAYAGQTLVESYDEGWAWSVPLSDEARCFTVMVDHRTSEFAGGDLAALLDAELGKAPHLLALLEGAAPDGDAWACPASLYTSSRFAESGLLLVGDAGSFIDPLSSYGVKKALASGWLGAVAVHTALIDPAMTDEALAFFDARERDVYRQYRRASAAFFQGAAEVYGTPYWRSRAEAALSAGAGTTLPSGTRADPDDVPFPGDADVPEGEVRAAFEVLKSLPTLAAVPGPDLRTRRRAAIEGLRIVRTDHLATDVHPAGLRYVRGVSLLRVLELAERHTDPAGLWQAYNQVAPPVSLPDFLTALSTAFAAGILVHRDR